MADPGGFKESAAEAAVRLVRPGMLLGLGTGSTTRYFIEGVGRLAVSGMALTAVATSKESAELATTCGIPLTNAIDHPIDLAVDGADEVDPTLNLVKGRGGALLREKLVAAASRRFIVIVDESKLVTRLGRGPLPIEITPFLHRQTIDRLGLLGSGCVLRGGESNPAVTDNGNYVADLALDGGIGEPRALATAIQAVPGVLAHGLFLGMARGCLVAGLSGIRVLGSLE